MLMRSTAVRVLVTAALGVSATLALPAAVAQAEPRSCWSRSWNGNDGWQGKCDEITYPGRDRYRAVAYCVRENGSRRTAYGPWISSIPYPVSYATCPVNYSASSGYLQTASS
ncbi:hypothetical protein JOF56_007839 [Kibdelosporangium banguiense]|uniref:Secreted protein n=1 Tax=Kibdelosporangium banguiense TaxID=1365924 RepID=A0ABS4TSR9_9PSEU|nr:hypothetical protein [Kibdelosporangium banguiense]MBP2327454.1 hypothetical protein [Kibdelosporangium banguiense]